MRGLASNREEDSFHGFDNNIKQFLMIEIKPDSLQIEEPDKDTFKASFTNENLTILTEIVYKKQKRTLEVTSTLLEQSLLRFLKKNAKFFADFF